MPEISLDAYILACVAVDACSSVLCPSMFIFAFSTNWKKNTRCQKCPNDWKTLQFSLCDKCKTLIRSCGVSAAVSLYLSHSLTLSLSVWNLFFKSEMPSLTKESFKNYGFDDHLFAIDKLHTEERSTTWKDEIYALSSENLSAYMCINDIKAFALRVCNRRRIMHHMAELNDRKGILFSDLCMCIKYLWTNH